MRSVGGVEGAICEEVEEPKVAGRDGRIDEMVGNRDCESSRAAFVWIWAMDMSKGRASSSSEDSAFILSRLSTPEKLDENEGRC